MMCGDVTARLVSSDWSRSTDLTPIAWEVVLVRSGVGQTAIDIDACQELNHDAWCDYLEVSVGGELISRHLYTGLDYDGMGGVRVSGRGVVSLLAKRRWERTETLTGTAGELWARVWDQADKPGPLGLEPVVKSGGPVLSIDMKEGDLLLKPATDLAAHITWSEHGGVLYDWLTPELPSGNPIGPSQLSDFSCRASSQHDTAFLANDVLVAFGDDLDRWARYPPGGRDAYSRCALQSGRFEFPEIRSEESAFEIAEFWQPILAEPRPVLTGVSLDPARVGVGDLIPGVWHQAAFSGQSDLMSVNLERAAIQGLGGCVTNISATYDQNDEAILRRLVT